jgi:prophage antirepressor-like protein
MNELQIFNNSEFGSVRVIEKDGTPWFVGKDIAEILGYSNSRKAMADHVDAEDKVQGCGVTIRDAIGREQNATLINESGVYGLILRSNMPKAREFKHWVTSDVLPSIRKHGAYMTDQTIHRAITDPDFLIQLATELKKEREEKAKALQKIEEDRPKVLFANAVTTSKKSCLVGELAKILRQNGIDMGQNRLFSWLRNNGYLCKYGERYNQPTQKSMEMELMEIKKTAISKPDGSVLTTITTKIKPHGQVYFINKFLGKETA